MQCRVMPFLKGTRGGRGDVATTSSPSPLTAHDTSRQQTVRHLIFPGKKDIGPFSSDCFVSLSTIAYRFPAAAIQEIVFIGDTMNSGLGRSLILGIALVYISRNYHGRKTYVSHILSSIFLRSCPLFPQQSVPYKRYVVSLNPVQFRGDKRLIFASRYSLMMAENANLFSIREGTGKGGQRRGQGREGGGQFENEETRLWLRFNLRRPRPPVLSLRY